MTAIACISPSRSPTRYVRGALLHPTSVTVASTALCFAACYVGLLAAAVTLVGVLAVAIGATRSMYIRAQLDAWDLRTQQRARDQRRVHRVEHAGPGRAHQYRELADLVEEVERADPAGAHRFELEPLLDQFVELARCQRRCIESLRYAPPAEAPVILRSAMRDDILARRVRRREDCRRQIERLGDDLAAIDELLHLVAHSVAATPSATETAAELQRRLWELDELDSAMAQLGTGNDSY
jgi:hypothetical protein